MRTDAEEIAHYDRTTASAESVRELSAKIAVARDRVGDTGLPLEAWLDTRFDSVAQEQAIRHLLPLVPGGRVVQIGGTGLAVLKALLGGAREGVLITPSQGELDLTTAVASEFGLDDRLRTICAFGEELPLDSGSVDVVISEASMHHTVFVDALAEAHRVLGPGGRFGCFEPWRAPLYGVGTRVLGKRDPGVECRPLDRIRVAGAERAFPGVRTRWHGAFSRYLMIGLSKLGVVISRERAHRVTQLDDRVARWVPGAHRLASSVCITGSRQGG